MSGGDEVLVALCTAPAAAAERLARSLVREHLAACVNLVGPIQSVFRWKGAVETSKEILLLIKTTRARFAELERRLPQLHPYECPELLAWPADAGLPSYLDWVRASVAGASPG